MDRSIVIRLGEFDDAPAVSELVMASIRIYSPLDCSVDGLAHLLQSVEPEMVVNYMQNGCCYHLAFDADELVGAVAIRDNMHLMHLFVAESHHRLGIAVRLWSIARDHAIQKGNPGEITVNSSSYGRPFYLKMGFVDTAAVVEKNGVRSIPMIWRDQGAGSGRPG